MYSIITLLPFPTSSGIHCGTVVGGVVGASILRYDVFGDTVNVAARMEATGEVCGLSYPFPPPSTFLSLPLQPMRVHVSEAAAEKLRGTKFILQERGKVEVKVRVLCPSAYDQSHMHTLTQHTHVYAHTLTHALMLTDAHMHTHAHTHAHTHTHTHAHTHAHTCSHMLTHHAHTCTHMLTHAHTHAHTCSHMHTHAH